MGVQTYAELKQHKSRIMALCQSTEARIAELAATYHNYKFVNLKELHELMTRINQENFKVIVIGKFSTGKSSLINALLGDDVLPDSLNPCTAYINEVTYGETSKAAIFFKNPLPEHWDLFVQNEDVKEHILEYKGSHVPEYVVDDLDALADCVTIPYNEDETEPLALDCSPFEKAVIYYPCELCKNGVEIIDSPGLDEARDRTEIVEAYLKKVDAVIYVTTNIATGGDGDKEILEHYLVHNEIKNVFFVCNLFGIKLAKAKKQLQARLNKIFADKTLLGERGIHMINVGDTANSGIEEFKEALGNYLSERRGTAQVDDYIERLKELIFYVKAGMPMFRCKSDVQLEQVDNQIADLQQRLASMEELLDNSKKTIAGLKYKIETMCRTDIMEKFKKLNYNAKAAVRTHNVAELKLDNDANETEALVLAASLTHKYTALFEQFLKEYLVKELDKSIRGEAASDIAKLQQNVNAFAANLDAKVREDEQNIAWSKITAVGSNYAHCLKDSLAMDIHDLVSFEALQLGNILEKLVKDVFYVYAEYQYNLRGAKLTDEVQGKIASETFEKLEHDKRSITNSIIKVLACDIENQVYLVLTSTMVKAITMEKLLLADLEELHTEVVAKLEQENAKCAEVVAALDEHVAALKAEQKEIL